MDDLKLLTDDHGLLCSSVVHVVALVRSLMAGRFATAGLHVEARRQADLLHGQVIEHFDFEETIVFPRLQELFPDFEEHLAHFVRAHDGLLQALDALRVALSYDKGDRNVLARALAFEQAFEEHAGAETNLFRELAVRLGL